MPRPVKVGSPMPALPQKTWLGVSCDFRRSAHRQSPHLETGNSTQITLKSSGRHSLARDRRMSVTEGRAAKDGGKPHYLGHRERLRERFLATAGEGMPDYELLEL